jgi:hypothetical protein
MVGEEATATAGRGGEGRRRQKLSEKCCREGDGERVD